MDMVFAHARSPCKTCTEYFLIGRSSSSYISSAYLLTTISPAPSSVGRSSSSYISSAYLPTTILLLPHLLADLQARIFPLLYLPTTISPAPSSALPSRLLPLCLPPTLLPSLSFLCSHTLPRAQSHLELPCTSPTSFSLSFALPPLSSSLHLRTPALLLHLARSPPSPFLVHPLYPLHCLALPGLSPFPHSQLL